MGRALTTVTTAAAVAALAGCGTRWVNITQAIATDPSATTLNVSVDACLSLPTPQVTETDAEIRIRIDGRVDDGKSQKACSGGAIVTLSRAIGARTVVVTRGAGQVSATPLTLSGTLKDDVLYVGLS